MMFSAKPINLKRFAVIFMVHLPHIITALNFADMFSYD